MFGGNVAPRTSVVDPRHRDEISAPHSFHLTSSLFRRASRSLRIPPPPPVAPRAPYESLLLRHSRKMRTRQGAHFFVEAEEEKKGGPLRQKFISGKDEFPAYTCLKMCSNDTLPQGSAAREARRLRLFSRLERGVKSAKMLLIQSSILMANIPPPSLALLPLTSLPRYSISVLRNILLLFMPRR